MYANENIPLYFRVYHKIKQNILAGEFERGTKIGIIGDLAKAYAVAPETMRRALHLLEMEGLLIRKQGLGTIIPKNANLDPIAIAQLVVHKKVANTVLNSEFKIISDEWVSPPRRVIKLYGMKETPPTPLVYKITHKLKIKDNPEYRVIASHYVTEFMFRELQLDRQTPPLKVILALAEWIDSTPLKLTESIRPYLCTDENAELLGLPDGTPVFYHDYVTCDLQNRCHYWESLSTANLHIHEINYE
jgi:DNA-binding GntR family transcriptional regulator